MKRETNRDDKASWALKSFKEADMELKAEKLEALLKDCVGQAVPMRLHAEGGDSRSWGKPREISMNALILDAGVEGEPGFQPGTEVRVEFSVGGRLYRFASQVIADSPHEERNSSWHLSLPDRIASSQVRRALRIPATWSADIKIHLSLDDRALGAKLIELSLGGFRARLRRSAKSSLQPCDLVTAGFEFRGLRAELIAEMRGLHGDAARFSFPGIVLDGGNRPPEDYRALLTAIGRAWSRSKSQRERETGKIEIPDFPPYILWQLP